MLGDMTIRRCSSPEIILIESSDENIDCLPTCSDLEENDIVSGTEVKDELNDASEEGWETSHERSETSGFVCRTGENSMDVQPDEDQSLSNRSHCHNDFSQDAALSGMKSDTPLLQTLYSKYGDITKGCNLKSETFKKGCFLAICRVVQKLHDTSIDDINSDTISELYTSIKDAESVNFNVKWLHQRLVEVEEVMKSRNELKRLEEAQKSSTLKGEDLQKCIQMNKLEVAKLEHEIEMVKEEQAVQKSRLEEVTALTDDIISSYHRFPVYLIDCLL